MGGVDGIGEDALARVESVGALGREGLGGFAARAGLGFGSFHFEQREIGDGAGPGDFGVIEGGIVARRRWELGVRHQDKNKEQQGGSYQGAAGDESLNPAFPEETVGEEVLRDTGPGQNGGDAGADPLMKASPGEVELRCFYHSRTRGSSRLGGRPKKIGCLEDPFQRHFPLDYSKMRAPVDPGNLTGLKTRHYKNVKNRGPSARATRPKARQAGPAPAITKKRPQRLKPSMR